jgi:enoyl-CoA hydratase/carnithine racemase
VRTGEIVSLVLNRPSRLNALDTDLVRTLRNAAVGLAADPGPHLITLTGSGRAFSSGIDLKALAEESLGMQFFVAWEDALRALETVDRIVIAGLHGYCLGGGLQLALACDIRVATPECQIGLPAIKEALIPGLAPWRLPRYVGWGRAKRMVLSGELISGVEAYEIGLVDYLVSADSFDAELESVVRRYQRLSRSALLQSKRMLVDFDLSYEEALRRYLLLQDRVYNSSDSREARSAFLEGRDPVWEAEGG